MDLVNKDKFKNWLLIILLLLNVLTVSIIWMKTFRSEYPAIQEQKGPVGDSTDVMKKALDLNENQAERINKIRSVQRVQSKILNDSLDALKLQLAKELFKTVPDTSVAIRKASQIGFLQSELEKMRFRHFNEILSISNKEQKEKLKPVIMDIFGLKPPQNKDNNWSAPMIKNAQSEPIPEEKPSREERKPAPDINEKVDKYSRRLSLSTEQVNRLRDIFSKSETQIGKLKELKNPDRSLVDEEKLKIKKEEDESIKRILDENQKREFEKMIQNRNR